MIRALAHLVLLASLGLGVLSQGAPHAAGSGVPSFAGEKPVLSPTAVPRMASASGPDADGTPEPAATPPIGDTGPVDWGDPSPTPKPTPRTVHAPSAFGRTYLRVPETQAARDWAWHKLGTVQWRCLDAIGHYESGWRVRAGSPDGSYGIFQANPASKMRRFGADYLTSALTQVRFGIAYANARYGSLCEAWSFWRAHGWW